MKKVLAIVLSAVMMLSLMPMAFASDAHNCNDAKDCLVCYLAELINSLPEAKEISVDNAAEVTDTLHAIDCVKFDLSDAEYDDLMTLVVNKESDIGGLPAPKAYMEALNAVVNLQEGCTFAISKRAEIAGIENYDLSESVVAFEITGADGYCATVTLRDAVQGVFTLDESQVESVDFFTATLASFDGYYTMEEQGWTYSYQLPAGTYTIKEITNTMVVNGTEYSGFDVSCNGEDANDGYTFTLTDGSKSVVQFSNTYNPYTLSFNANGGEGWMDFQEISTNGRVQIPENEFVNAGYIFVGWNTTSDGSGVSYLPGETARFYDSTVLFAQWQDCTPHNWINGICTECGKECEHSYSSEITSRPESTDGITWTDGEKTYTCECGEYYTEEVVRADYSEYIEAELKFAELIATEDLTEAAKAEIVADYNELGELQQNLIIDEQEIVNEYTDKLNALIEKIKAGIADGSYLKADTSEAETLISEIEAAGIEDENLKAEFEEIKAEVEKIKADENASKAEYEQTLNEYVEKLTSIKNTINSTPVGNDEFRCDMCDTYEKNKDVPVIGFFYTIIHFFCHLAQRISHMS